MPEINSEGEPRVRLSEEQVREVKRIRQELRDGKMLFATDEEMVALWRKCGLKD